MIVPFIERYIKLETFAGVLLIAVSALAMGFANIDSFSGIYAGFQHLEIGISVGSFALEKSLMHWVNDGLMTLFFFLITLEIKREVCSGELSSINKAMLPVIGAVGGMVVPALVYAYFNMDSADTLKGWAIPTATDIAFALGILMIIGKKAPLALKIFLTTLAVVDDLGAIIVLAVFYTNDINLVFLGLSGGVTAVMLIMGQLRVVSASVSLALGAVLWLCLLKSGIHPTLAGVVTAISIPRNARQGYIDNPMEHLEHRLHGWVTFAILPLFAFINAGVPLSGANISLTAPVSMGILMGLFFGKQIGVFVFCYIAVRMKWAVLPTGVNELQLYGVSVLCGIGFTMSLFIGSIPFEGTQVMDNVKLSIILASLASTLLGASVLYLAHNMQKKSKALKA